MYYIRSECSFDSAHFLKGYIGKCSNLHGHRWRVVVELAAEELSEEEQTRGMVLDFGDLKALLRGAGRGGVPTGGSAVPADGGELRALFP